LLSGLLRTSPVGLLVEQPGMLEQRPGETVPIHLIA
jgi:hypothetical protein